MMRNLDVWLAVSLLVASVLLSVVRCNLKTRGRLVFISLVLTVVSMVVVTVAMPCPAEFK